MVDGSVAHHWQRSRYPLAGFEYPQVSKRDVSMSQDYHPYDGNHTAKDTIVLHNRPGSHPLPTSSDGHGASTAIGRVNGLEKPAQPYRPSLEHDSMPYMESQDDNVSLRSTATRRSLRRTQRSPDLGQLAKSPPVTSLEEASTLSNEALPSSKSAAHQSTGPVHDASLWTRQVYPPPIRPGSPTPQDVDITPPTSKMYTQNTPSSSSVASPPHNGNQSLASTAAYQRPMVQDKDVMGTEIRPQAHHLAQKQDQGSGTTIPLRRHAYPLQAPASYANLRSSPTPPSSPETYPETTPIIEFPSKRVSDDVPRRRVYPLQSTVSVADLGEPQTPPLSPIEATTQAPQSFGPPSEELPHNPAKKAHMKRQVYPLQSSASIPVLNVVPPSSLSPQPIIEDVSSEEERSVAQQRQTELAGKVVKHWRRQVYPAQSPETTWGFDRAPTPQPEIGRQQPAGPIHLPKNIRALKDARQSEPEGRTIVVCLDGTGDKFDSDNSNIVHLISALKKDDPRQVTYYQAGIGTYGASGLSSGFEAVLDMAVGAGLGLHVRDGELSRSGT
jgi:hypothetical protein